MRLLTIGLLGIALTASAQTITSVTSRSAGAVTVDPAGNIYFSDDNYHRIYRIPVNTNSLTPMAGKSSFSGGYSGDLGPAMQADISAPKQIAVDDANNLVYFADTGNSRVRRISLVTGWIDSPPIAGLLSPEGVAVDSAGNLYVADTGHHRVLKYVPGGTVSTFAGTGSATYSGENVAATTAGLPSPRQIAVDSSGNLYIPSLHRIRKVTAGGVISTFAGGSTGGYNGEGSLATAQLNSPSGVALDGLGNVYIADTGNARLRKISGVAISTVATGTIASVATDPNNHVLFANNDLTAPSISMITGSGNPGLQISGKIVDSGGAGIAGVVLYLFGGGVAVTAADGTYSFTGLAIGRPYRVTPVAGKRAIEPHDYSGAILLSDLTTANFSARTRVPTTVYRETNNRIQLFRSGVKYDGGGVFASNPGASQNYQGNTVVAARDTFNTLWAAQFDDKALTWDAWQHAGGVIQGDPAIAGTNNPSSGFGPAAWIAVRDGFNSYWIVSFDPASGFGAWRYLAGIFSTDPQITVTPDGSLFIVGKDNSNSLWCGHYIPSTDAFEGWIFGGGVIQGKPSLTASTDGRAYIFARDSSNNLWAACADRLAWIYWIFAGGVRGGIGQDPVAGAGTPSSDVGNVFNLFVQDFGGAVYQDTFDEALVRQGNFNAFASRNGLLAKGTIAQIETEYDFFGLDAYGSVWTMHNTSSYNWTPWTIIGHANPAVAAVIGAPR